MSKLITNTIRHTGATSDSLTFNSDGHATVENNLTVDGTSTLTGNVTATGTLSASNFSNRNIVINGAFQVWQRGTSSSAAGYQTADRFKTTFGGNDEDPTRSKLDLTSSDTGPWAEGFRAAYRITNGNQTSTGAGDWIQIEHKIEAQDMANSGWDYNSASSKITLSFWVKSSIAQTFYGFILLSDGTTQQYPFSLGALAANTWTKVTKTIPGHANLTFNNDTGEGLRITIIPFYGTTYTSSGVTLDAWSAYGSGTDCCPDYTDTWYDTDDATFDITGVQLEVGDVATEFEHRSFGDELLKCARYYQEQQGHSDYHIQAGKGQGTTTVDAGHSLVVPLRGNPTIVCSANRVHRHDGYSDSTTAPTVTTWDSNHSPHSSILGINLSGHSSITSNYIVGWTPKSALFKLDAEL